MANFKIANVLISDDIDQICIDRLKENGIHVTLKHKWAKDELLQEVGKYDALIVRSATKVTRQVIEAGKNLKVIGRAGTGVDNIDCDAASEHGIIVMNTPAGNGRSVSELTSAYIVTLARHIAQADASMKRGAWDRKLYMGNEVHGKTLALIGLGRIGRDVAEKMQFFGMKTIGYDPLVSAEDAAKFGVTWMALEEIWPRADYISLHVPLIPQTENMVNAKVFAKCKKGVKIINCARGGTCSEHDLLEALKNGQCGGAGFDVFLEEPPKNRELIEHPKFVGTPHLGASTVEAQVRVAEEIADQIVSLSQGKSLLGAINGQAVACALDKSSANVVKAVEHLSMVAQTVGAAGPVKHVTVEAPECAKKMEMALKAAAIIGLLKQTTTTGTVNLVNALNVGKTAGIHVDVVYKSSTDACHKFSVKAGSLSVAGCPTECGTLLFDLGNDSCPLGVPLRKQVVFYEGTTDAFAEIRKNNLPASPLAIFNGCHGKRHVAVYDCKEKIDAGAAKHIALVHFDD